MMARTPLSAAVTARWSPAKQQHPVWASLWSGPKCMSVMTPLTAMSQRGGRTSPDAGKAQASCPPSAFGCNESYQGQGKHSTSRHLGPCT